MTRVRLAVLASLILIAISAASTAAQTTYAPAGADWPTYNGTVDSRRFSALSEINTTNVKKLRPVWMFQTGIANTESSFECTPLVVNGTMYVTAPDNTVTALDAATGALKWQHKPLIPVSQKKLCCGKVNRGVGYYRAAKPEDDIVYVATLDARLIALHAGGEHVGKPVKTFGLLGTVLIADPNEGYSETAAPVVWKDKVFIGVAGGEFPIRGFISAYDALTGKMIWRWHTIPEPGEPGGDSWPPGKYLEGGVAVWMNPTIDEKYNQVLFATGNPNPDFDGRSRKGDNLYSCGIAAVDADTGKFRWFFQEVRHDLWDYDQTNAPILFTTNITGKPVDAAGAAGKTGWFYMIDRATGKSIVPLKEVKVPTDGVPDASPVQYVPDDGPPYNIKPFVPHTNMWTPPKVVSDSNVAPGLSGGAEWSPLSYSPKTNYIYVAAVQKEMYFCRDPLALKKKSFESLTPTEKACVLLAIYVDSTGLSLGGVAIVPPTAVVSGAFIAINPDTGNVVPNWRHDTTPHPIGGTLATAGDLVFAGESNGFFDALDARTGALLWQFQCGAGVNAAPMTYIAKDASGKTRQYVAVAAGGLAGASLPNTQVGDPNAFKYFRNGNTIIVFALPDE